MNNNMIQKLNKDILLEEYRQLMESQRDNTRITYSWLSNIFIVLSSALFVFGLTTASWAQFVPAMFFGILLAWIWVFLTEVFGGYIRQRFDRIREISEQIGIATIKPPKSKLRIAKTYVILFAILYTMAWLIRLIYLIGG